MCDLLLAVDLLLEHLERRVLLLDLQHHIVELGMSLGIVICVHLCNDLLFLQLAHKDLKEQGEQMDQGLGDGLQHADHGRHLGIPWTENV